MLVGIGGHVAVGVVVVIYCRGVAIAKAVGVVGEIVNFFELVI